MSYEYLENGIPNFDRGIINLWFRPPLSSLKKLADRAWDERKREDDGGVDSIGSPIYIKRRLWKWMPLLTWGPLANGYQIHHVDAETADYTRHEVTWNGSAGWIFNPGADTVFPDTFTGLEYSAGRAIPLRPSGLYISAEWEQDDNGHKTKKLITKFDFRIQMADSGTGSWLFKQDRTTFSDYYRTTALNEPGHTAPVRQVKLFSALDTCRAQAQYPDGEWKVNTTFTDKTTLWSKRNGPEAFESKQFDVKPDRWHHFLASFDTRSKLGMKGRGRKIALTYPDCPDESIVPIDSGEAINKITNAGKMWVRFNDVNDDYPDVNNDEASEFNFGIKKNETVPQNVYDAAGAIVIGITRHTFAYSGSEIEELTQTTAKLKVPTYEYKPTPIPSDKKALGFPGTPELVDDILKVEMAEGMIFTGVTLDTGKKENAEAFITGSDTDGLPVNPKKAVELLGVEPVVKLHGSGKWIAGDNTGSLGDREPGDIDFTTVKKIRSYRPRPSLRGDQGKSN